ncbi:MAG: FAD-binding oxidoreductase [Actinobacteria bacterium]|nr:FAD-binding oxidoreductase [Actinomycetota bacterium]
MTTTFSPRIAAGLRGRLSGRVVLPGEQDYDAARQVWNASHDHRPALIVQPRTTGDVQAAVRFAGEHGLPVCVRGGGHNHAGYAVADGALMLDLSAMTSVRVDPARRRAIVGGGAVWGVVDQATQAAGLAVTGADVSAVGVGGATLGGGAGWLHRKLGLSCDNLLAAEIITADARVLSVSTDEHPELFWALRGGGGNFGAVTAFTFALHPVGPVPTAVVLCPVERAAGALTVYRHLCQAGGDELFVRAMLLTAPPAPFVPEPLRGRPAVLLAAAWFGPPAQASSALAELRRFGPPGAGLPQPMPYPELQRMSDAMVPRRVRAVSLGGFTGPLSAAVIDAIAAAAAEPPPMCAVMLQPLGGAVARVPADATAVRHRHAAHYLAVNTIARPEDSGAEQAGWAEKVNDSLPAGTILGPGLHAMGRDEPEERVRAAYGEAAYARLAAVKAAYDPGNAFRFNQNIRPRPSGGTAAMTGEGR